MLTSLGLGFALKRKVKLTSKQGPNTITTNKLQPQSSNK